jgi:hypothetical protein
MPRNHGEENEVFLKAFLVDCFYNKTELPDIGVIKDLNFFSVNGLPDWEIRFTSLLEERDYLSLKDVFHKAPARSKSDIEINRIKYSVKNTMGAKSAIVNHTNRRGFLRVCELLNIDISQLDEIINEYWNKRIAGVIMEDVPNSSHESPFARHKEYLKPIIEYFLFKGTGSSDSNYPADKMLIFENPTDPSTYKILTKSEAVDHMWGSLVFSVRSKKGMPVKEINGVKVDGYDPEIDFDLTPWIRYYPDGANFPKGALHIRT